MKKTVFLVSGIGLRPDLKIVRYWRDAPKILESLGYTVIVVDVDAFGAIETNLEIIFQRINKFFRENPGTNTEYEVWGHSKGGVEVLNLLDKNPFCNKISSFVLLNSPIKGSVMAKRILKSPRVIKKFIVFVANFIGRIMGDRNPDLERALEGLIKDHSHLLTKANSNVYIFQTAHDFRKLPWVWKPVALIAYGRAPKGDGIVEYQDLDWANGTMINVNSIDSDRILHSSVAGIPYFSGFNSKGFRHLWIELAKAVNNSGNNLNDFD